MIQNRLHDERASVPLALLLVIIVGSLIAVSTTRMVAAVKSVRFDRDYTIALHAADAGVEQAVFRLNNRLYAANATSFGDSGTLQGVSYTWNAAYSSSTRSWTVTSQGGPAAVTRNLEAEVRQQPFFDLAAFAKDGVDLNGNNVANSYNSRIATPNMSSHGCAWDEGTPECSTGYGLVGSNGNILYQNENSIADGTMVYNWTDNNGPQRCQNSTVLCSPPERVNIGPARTFEEELNHINTTLAACGSLQSWKASDHQSGSTPVTFPFDPGTHCFSELILDVDTVLKSTVTADNPLKLYVRDFVVLGGKAKTEINCTGCKSGYQKPAASALYIFTAANDGTTKKPREGVKVTNQTDFAAAIMAPNASCGTFSGSNAGVDVYGSIVCKAIRNVGNWSFHYDEDLRNGLLSDRYTIARWTEQ